MAFITIDGENKIALQQGTSQLLNITHFVLANITGLGAEPVDRIEAMPAVGDIVDTRAVTKSGYVNTNQVVYSLALDSTIGDYTFNWVGLKDADDVLIAVVYLADPIVKTATNGGTEGNNLVRNFLLAFAGIQATTAISAPAETWQIDFTTRLIQIDERERLSNLDIYGHDAFYDGAMVTTLNAGTVFDVSAGIAYVGGIRCEFETDQQIDVGVLPNSIWIDASLQGDLTGKNTVITLVADAGNLVDYTDGLGFDHYVAKICDITGGAAITDQRVKSVLFEGVPLGMLDYPSIDTSDNRLVVTPSAATNGGVVSISSDIFLRLAEVSIAGKTGRMRTVKTRGFICNDLDVSSTYYLRAKFINGTFTLYTQKGTDADVIPANLVGTVDGVSGGGFDSSVLDMLIAKIETGGAGTIPTIISFANNAELNASATYLFNVVGITKYSRSLDLNWARKPWKFNQILVGFDGFDAVALSTPDISYSHTMQHYRVFDQVSDRYSCEAQIQVLDDRTTTTNTGIEIKYEVSA